MRSLSRSRVALPTTQVALVENGSKNLGMPPGSANRLKESSSVSGHALKIERKMRTSFKSSTVMLENNARRSCKGRLKMTRLAAENDEAGG